tara:strand:+ start:1304 stop:2326 length:1023 start_codon:yes stop_codon:yes gene_type:complete
MPGGVHEYMKAWDPEEDQIILEMLDTLGPKWSKIVQRLPGRTVSSVRNRWQRIDKGRKLRESGQQSKNRCQQCGKPKRGHVCMARLKNRGERGLEAESALQQWEDAQGTGSGDEEAEVRAPLPRVSREASAETKLVRVAEAKQEEGAGGAEYASVENAVVPLLSHMKSGPRICRELGFSLGGSGGSFSALAAAAEAELKRSESCSSMSGGSASTAAVSTSTEPSVSEPSVSRMSSVQSVVEDVPPSRMPSLSSADLLALQQDQPNGGAEGEGAPPPVRRGPSAIVRVDTDKTRRDMLSAADSFEHAATALSSRIESESPASARPTNVVLDAVAARAESPS